MGQFQQCEHRCRTPRTSESVVPLGDTSTPQFGSKSIANMSFSLQGRVVDVVTGLYSEWSLVRMVNSPKGHWSEWSIVLRVISPNGHWSEG